MCGQSSQSSQSSSVGDNGSNNTLIQIIGDNNVVGRYCPSLAHSLGPSFHGEREKAQKTAEKAVAIRKDLAAQYPETFKRDLAISLNILADIYSASASKNR